MALPCDFDETGLVIPTVIDFSNEARDLFYEWRNQTIQHMNVDDEGNEIDERIMKMHLSVARFSLVFQILKWTCNEAELDYVDEESVKSAIQLNEYFENGYKRIEKLIKDDGIPEQKKLFWETSSRHLPPLMRYKPVMKWACLNVLPCTRWPSSSQMDISRKQVVANMRNCNKYTPFAGCSLCSLQYAPGMISNNFINNIPMEMRRKLRGSFSLFTPMSMLCLPMYGCTI